MRARKINVSIQNFMSVRHSDRQTIFYTVDGCKHAFFLIKFATSLLASLAGGNQKYYWDGEFV